MLSKPLQDIIDILKNGGESDTYIDTVTFLFNRMVEDKENGTFERDKYINPALSIHIRLRNRHKEDFNGSLLTWYRRFIELYEDSK